MTPIARRTALAFAGALAAPAVLRAQPARLKLGLITTLSGPGGYTGQDIRDAMLLAAELEGGTLGGTPIQFVVEDDALKPALAKEIADRMFRSDGIRLFSGIVFSNVLAAAIPDLLDNDAIYVSANAAPSTFAGKDCNRNYYVISWQNDALHESAGANANRLGYKRMVLLAPNYQAGKDALTGFKRLFKGQVIRETYTRLDQTDYGVELAQTRDDKPDAVYQFHPGGLGIAFLRQYQQAGLLGTVPMTLSEVAMDSTILAAVGEAAIGISVAAHWNADFTNPANIRFVDAFVRKYNRTPTIYAAQGFDTALAIGAALKGTGGKIDPDTFRKAMLPANFASVRGKFAFGNNQHPICDWWSAEVERGPAGKPIITTKDKVLENHVDAYAPQCKL